MLSWSLNVDLELKVFSWSLKVELEPKHVARVRSALLHKDRFTFVSPGSPTAEKRGDDDITDDDDEKN